MTGGRPNALLDVICGKTHDRSHGRAERFLATQSENRYIKLAFRDESFVVDCVLIECRKLREARAHRTGTCVELGIMAPCSLSEVLRLCRELVPEAVEVDTLATLHQSFHIGTAEPKMPKQRILEDF